MDDQEQPRAPPERPLQSASTQMSPQEILKRLYSEVLGLRKEIGSELHPALTNTEQMLRSLEAYITIGLGARLTAELSEQVAAEFEKQRERERRKRRWRRSASALTILTLLVLLAAEMWGDAITEVSHRLIAEASKLIPSDGLLRLILNAATTQ